MTILSKYTGGLRTECTHIQSGTVMHTDAPTDNYGLGESFSPTDLLATAAGTCAITFLAIQARNEGVELDGSILEITKIMSISPPRRIEKIEIVAKMSSNLDLTADQISRYEEIARTCPVMLSLHPDLEKEIVFQW